MHTLQSIWEAPRSPAWRPSPSRPRVPRRAARSPPPPHGRARHAGSLVYNVFEDQWKAQLGQGSDTRVPKDRFFLVRLSVVNGGSTDLMVPS
jgi:hypothetical protein